jgi:hypothetical protein
VHQFREIVTFLINNKAKQTSIPSRKSSLSVDFSDVSIVCSLR